MAKLIYDAISSLDGDWLEASTIDVPYSLLHDWVHEGLHDPDIGLRQDHPDARTLGAVLI
jgi:hypothetical protein